MQWTYTRRGVKGDEGRREEDVALCDWTRSIRLRGGRESFRLPWFYLIPPGKEKNLIMREAVGSAMLGSESHYTDKGRCADEAAMMMMETMIMRRVQRCGGVHQVDKRYSPNDEDLGQCSHTGKINVFGFMLLQQMSSSSLLPRR